MSHRPRRAVASIATIALLVAATAALAVSPKPGLYGIGGFGEGGGGFTLKGGKLAKGATVPSKFKCNKVNAAVPVAIPVSSGRFSYHGKLKGQAGTLTFKGHWTTAKTVSGTATIVKGACKSSVTYKATLTTAG